jgi:glycerol-3-phosphate dehydrogenase (NAD(P)+)
MAGTAVIGTGAWGTIAANLAMRAPAAGGGRVVLLGRPGDKTVALAATRVHPDLGGQPIDPRIEIGADPAALAGCDLVLWAVPTQHSRVRARELAAFLPEAAPLVSLSKGLEEGSLSRVTEVLGSAAGGRPLACLSGPSLAAEVAAGKPLGLVVAGSAAVVALVQARLHTPRCRLYTSGDLVGVELGGALKNVIAIAAGISDGLSFGDNAKAAIITRGLAEMRRLGRALGAADATFAGLAGVGDLLTTCYSPLGRNRNFGLAVARGENPLALLQRLHTVAEGAWTSRAAVELGRRHDVELPIASQVASVIWDATPVPQAMAQLLSRAPKEEDA